MEITLGTEKQISFANKIKEAYLALNIKEQFDRFYNYSTCRDEYIDYDSDEYKKINFSFFNPLYNKEDGKLDLELLEKYKELKILDIIENQPNSIFWINNYKQLVDKFNVRTVDRIEYVSEFALEGIIKSINKDFDRTKEAGFAHFQYCGIEIDNSLINTIKKD